MVVSILIRIYSSNLKKAVESDTKAFILKEGAKCMEQTYCVNTSSVDMFKNKIDIYLIMAGYTNMITLLDSRKANGFLVHLLSGTYTFEWQSSSIFWDYAPKRNNKN